ncbi:hypothetical protein CICLE_v10006427mg [Citrus x clementina]|uniref:MADS-box domain-containing protein n=1 Tax=Citrus clementina TaxID=85681 RepID=V4RKD2_CITCL|nr:hypothetical protein CICLE_v10006427mg [Citrus x clementina]
MVSPKTRGRQKIEIKKIENEDDRMITFSKRRSGIHKKASELVTLTGAEIGIVRISELNQQHNELLCWLDEENAREKILNQNRKGKETQPHWWETPVDENEGKGFRGQ